LKFSGDFLYLHPSALLFSFFAYLSSLEVLLKLPNGSSTYKIEDAYIFPVFFFTILVTNGFASKFRCAFLVLPSELSVRLFLIFLILLRQQSQVTKFYHSVLNLFSV
jgi:hypothetical protein